MSTYKYIGGRHCANIALEMNITCEPNFYNPRACDCDFCSKHGASYISDKKGKLTISVKNESNLGKCQQGSGIADFLICKICGVLGGVYHEEQGRLYAAINSKAVDKSTDFGEEIMVSPQRLNDNEKIQQWKNVWFSDVSIKKVSA